MKKIEIDGETYTLASATDGKIQQGLINLVKKSARDPLAEVASIVKDLPPQVQIELLKEAMQRKYTSQTPEQTEQNITDYVNSAEGMEAFLSMLWRRHQPDLSVDQVWVLHGKAIEKCGEKYFE